LKPLFFIFNYLSKSSVFFIKIFLIDPENKNNLIKNISKRETLAINDQKVTDASSRKAKAIRCFRCKQLGHKSPECPYSFKELAEMEEKGLLN